MLFPLHHAKIPASLPFIGMHRRMSGRPGASRDPMSPVLRRMRSTYNRSSHDPQEQFSLSRSKYVLKTWNFSQPISAIPIRGAYARAARDFLTRVSFTEWRNLADIASIHVAAWIETLGQSLATPSLKQHLAAIRRLFDWLVTGQITATNPAASVRGPRTLL